MYTDTMIVTLHIIIALASIIAAGYALVRPTQKSLINSYTLMALTLASGVYLVVNAPAHMIEACTMGVSYLAIVTTMTFVARAKYVRLKNNSVHSK